MDQNGKCIDKCDNYPECKPCGDLISFKLCECGSNERAALDCTMKTCRHPKYIENLKAEALANQKEEEDKRIKENNLERERNKLLAQCLRDFNSLKLKKK